MKRGIYAGSFDSITHGHLDIIRRAAPLVDQLHVMIGLSPKKAHGLFSPQKRLVLIRKSLERLEWLGKEFNFFVIDEFTGLLVDYCRTQGIQFNIRGLRAAQDFNYEFEMRLINCDMAPDVRTVFLPASPAFQFLSSSAIKELASHRSPALKKYVTPYVASALFDLKS